MSDKKETLVLYRDCGETYTQPPLIETQEAVDGIKFDFNYGMRIAFPPELTQNYFLEMTDINGLRIGRQLIQSANTKDGILIQHDKKYYFQYIFRLYRESDPNTCIFEHKFSVKDKKVLITLNSKALGDNICWFPYFEEFRKERGCELYVCVNPIIRNILEKQYPDIHFLTREEAHDFPAYATYYPGIFWVDEEHNFQPTDFRFAGLHQQMAFILGLDPGPELKPKFDLSAPRLIKEPYVCIATQASGYCKLWLYPNGWNILIKYIKSLGYRVICVDRDFCDVYGFVSNPMPAEAENMTGEQFSLQDRIDILKDADFFVGLGSGLSWMAWACETPVVMISGFTHPATEFYTPYRVYARNTCNSCWNDFSLIFNNSTAFDCPHFKGKNEDRMFECSRNIHPNVVIEAINKIPCVKKILNARQKKRSKKQ